MAASVLTSLEAKRAYHREYNKRRRVLNPGIDIAACRRWREKNLEYDRQRNRDWKAANRDHVREYSAGWRASNPEYHSGWRSANVERCRAYLANYRGRKAHATPAWANLEEIAAIYQEASRMTAESGVPHEVDHTIPLSGKNVCGLHVQTNLQVLPASANRVKGNKFSDELDTMLAGAIVGAPAMPEDFA